MHMKIHLYIGIYVVMYYSWYIYIIYMYCLLHPFLHLSMWLRDDVSYVRTFSLTDRNVC